MKNRIEMKPLFLVLLFTASGTALAGGNGSHGGDVLVGQFTGSMSNLIAAIGAKNPAACAPKADLDRVFDQVSVYGKAVVFCDGHEQDACSYLDDTNHRVTDLSRIRLIQVKNAPLYMNLVLHEYYVHLGLEKTNQMTLSKNCLDALSGTGVNVPTLMNQISPLSSIEEQMSTGKIFLSWAQGVVKFSFAWPLDVPRCTDSVSVGGDFPTATTNCSRTESFPYSIAYQYRLGNTLWTVAYLSKTPLTSHLSGSYDVATGDYTVSVSYDDLEVWTNRGSGDRLYPLSGLSSLRFTSKNHEDWFATARGSAPVNFRETPPLPLTPVLRVQ